MSERPHPWASAINRRGGAGKSAPPAEGKTKMYKYEKQEDKDRRERKRRSWGGDSGRSVFLIQEILINRASSVSGGKKGKKKRKKGRK